MRGELRRFSELGEDASPEAAFMRALVRTERTALPSDTKVRESPVASAGILATGRSAARASSTTRRRLALLSVVALFTMVGAYTLWSGRSLPRTSMTSPATDGAPSIVKPPRPERPLAQPSESRAPAVPMLSVDVLPQASAMTSPRTVAGAALTMCKDEVAFLERADAALRANDAAGALALTREHAARCGGGAFVQERERIAIEALASLNRSVEMRRRALAFEEHYPTSPHLRRIRKLLHGTSGVSKGPGK